MGVYKYFGGVPELLQAVADEGFRRQAAAFARVINTDDAMTDLSAMALACRDFAHDNPHLYDLMFGLSIQGRYSPTRGEAAPVVRDYLPAFKESYACLHQQCARLVDSGVTRVISPDLIAVQFWSALHGFIMLELGGHFADMANPAADILLPMCINLVVGLGVKQEQAEASAAAAIAGWHKQVSQESMRG